MKKSGFSIPLISAIGFTLLCLSACPNSSPGLPEINVKTGDTDLPSGTGSCDFGNMYVDGAGGTASGETTITIQNTGNSNLTLSGVSISAGDSSDFILTDSSAATVPAS